MESFNDYLTCFPELGEALFTIKTIKRDESQQIEIQAFKKVEELLYSQPYPTFKFLALGFPKFTEISKKKIQEIYFATLLRLLGDNNNVYSKQRFFNLFVNNDNNHINIENIIPEVKNRFSDEFDVAICLLGVLTDFTVLRKFDDWEDFTDKSVFLNVVERKKHWIDLCLDGNFLDEQKLFLVKLSNKKSDRIISKIDPTRLSGFSLKYFWEIERQQKLMKFIKIKNFTDISRTFNLIDFLSMSLNLSQVDYHQIRNLINENFEFNLKITEFENQENFESYLFDQYSTLRIFLEIIFIDSSDMENQLLLIRIIFRNIKNLSSFVELLEAVFSLLFLRYDHQYDSRDLNETMDPAVSDENPEESHSSKNYYSKSPTGFICSKIIVFKILNTLKTITTQKKHSKQFEESSEILKAKFQQITNYINDGLWRLSLFNTTQLNENQTKFENFDPKTVVRPYPPDDNKSSSDDEVTPEKTHQNRRRPRKKRFLQKSDESESTNLEILKKSFEEQSSNSSGRKCGTSIITKMLGSSESLVAVCLSHGDLENIKLIIKNHHLENTTLAHDISFSENFQETKTKLKEIFEKYKSEELNQLPSESKTPIPLIKKVVAVGLEVSKILNIIENFTMSQRIQQTKESIETIQKYRGNYQFLNLYRPESIQGTVVVDLLISLANNYDISLNLFNLIVKSCGEDGSKLGHFGFLKRCLQCLFCYKNLKNENLSVAHLMTEQSYGLVPKSLEEKLVNESVFSDLLTSDKSDIFKIDLKSKFNYFQRICCFLENSKRLLQYLSLKQFEPDELMKMDLVAKIGESVFHYKITPFELEGICNNLGINLTIALVGNCYPNINQGLEKSLVLEYLRRSNSLIAFLLEEIYGIQSTVGSNCFRNLSKLKSIEVISKVYGNNLSIAALNSDEVQLEGFDELEILENLSELQYKKCREVFDDRIDEIVKDRPELIEKIRSLNLKAEILLENLIRIERPEKILQMIKDILLNKRSSELKPELEQKLQKCLKNLIIFQEIVSIFGQISWIEVQNLTIKEPDKILSKLIEERAYDLCLKWIEHFPLKDQTENYSKLKMAFAIALHKDGNKILLKIIESTLPEDQIIEFYNKLIFQTKNSHLIQYFLQYLISKTGKPFEYQKFQISLNIFNETNEYLWPLISRPLLLIEQYLMNSKFEILHKIMKSIKSVLLSETCSICAKQNEKIFYLDKDEDLYLINIDYNHNNGQVTSDCIDFLLRMYATKSLEFHVVESQIINLSMELTSIDSLYGVFTMPNEAPSKENWIKDNEATHCMSCKRSAFTMLTRRHHCRRCGRVICHSCSTQRMIIPNMYDDVFVRVCSDCFKQTNNPQADVSQDVVQEESQKTENWILSGTLKHDNLVRDEFCYEYSPSVSLCLSILSLHRSDDECAKFLLICCEKFEKLLKPIQTGYPNPEIDYSLVTRILNCLALAAKVRGGIPSETNQMLDHADIIKSIVKNGCESLLPLEPLNSKNLRKLRDSLVKTEKWSLALEISLKCGLSSNGVMAAWGIAGLKSGCYDTAREKLSYCMTRISTDEINSKIINSIETGRSESVIIVKRPSKSPALLAEILKILELNSKKTTQPEVMARASIILNSTKSLSSTDTKSREFVPVHEPALNILQTLSNLNRITSGNYGGENVQPIPVKSRFYEECLYYLTSYGSHSDIVSFLVKYNQVVPALKYFIMQNVEPEIFINSIFLPYLRNGDIETIVRCMMDADETLLIWKEYVIQTCRYLETKNLLNSLYQMQILLKDPVRASMTCVLFYSMNCTNFTELANNSLHLINAQRHLQTELELCQWEEIKIENPKFESETSLLMKMDSKSLNNHINTILRQIEVAKFLAACEKDDKKVFQILSNIFIEVKGIPTLFGSINEKIQLAVLTLICGKNIEEGFGLAFRIIQDFHLNSMKVYGITTKYLANSSKIPDVEKLIDCVKSNSDSDNCDELLFLAVETAIDCNGNQLKSSVDCLIRLVKDVAVKINCQIKSGHLKSAYLLAVQNNRLNDVRKIMRQAEITNQVIIKRLCEKKLNISKM